MQRMIAGLKYETPPLFPRAKAQNYVTEGMLPHTSGIGHFAHHGYLTASSSPFSRHVSYRDDDEFIIIIIPYDISLFASRHARHGQV